MEIRRGWNLELTVEAVLRGQGMDPGSVRRSRPKLAGAAEWALQEGTPLLNPEVLQVEFDVEEVRHEHLLLAGSRKLTGQLIVQHLARARVVVGTVCTIGDALESISSELLTSDPLLGMALEGVGIAAIEELASQACSDWEERALSQGWKTSIPLSPGMVGWGVDPGQRQLFNLFEAGGGRVRLNSSLMMEPRMSISQVIGVGEELDIRGRPCDFCNLNQTCRYQDHYPNVVTGSG